MSVLGQRRIVVFVLAVAFGLALVFALSRVSLAEHTDTHEPNPNGVPPEPFEVDMVVEDACPDFAVHFEGGGKIKEIQTPDGGTLLPAPGFRVTLTNVEEPENQVTVHNTSAWKFTPLPDGTTLLVIPGQVLSWPPLELLVGRHTALLDSEGEIIEEVRSQGKEVDLCARLA